MDFICKIESFPGFSGRVFIKKLSNYSYEVTTRFSEALLFDGSQRNEAETIFINVIPKEYVSRISTLDFVELSTAEVLYS